MNKEEPKPQIDRFKEAARQLDADESKAALDEKLRALAGHNPKPENQKRGE